MEHDAQVDGGEDCGELVGYVDDGAFSFAQSCIIVCIISEWRLVSILKRKHRFDMAQSAG